MTKKSSRFGREPILKSHERARGQALTAANHREDDLDRAKRILDRLKADEPAMRARIDEAFDEMAKAREELKEALDGAGDQAA